jgi:hypothetical protein
MFGHLIVTVAIEMDANPTARAYVRRHEESIRPSL